MSINIGTNIKYQGKDFLDVRKSVNLKADLKAYDLLIPVGFEVFCREDSNWYIYDPSYNDSVTGHFIKRSNQEYTGSLAAQEDAKIVAEFDDFIDKAFPYKLITSSTTRFYEVGEGDNDFQISFWVQREETVINKDRSYYYPTDLGDHTYKIVGKLDSRTIFTVESSTTLLNVNSVSIAAQQTPTTKDMEVILYVDGELKTRYYITLVWSWLIRGGFIPENTFDSFMADPISYFSGNSNYLFNLTNFSTSSTELSSSILANNLENKGYCVVFIPKNNFFPLNSSTVINPDTSYELFHVDFLDQRTSNFSVRELNITTTYGQIVKYCLFILDYPINTTDVYINEFGIKIRKL